MNQSNTKSLRTHRGRMEKFCASTKRTRFIVYVILAILLLAGCKKTELEQPPAPPPTVAAAPDLIGGIDLRNPIFVQDRPNPDAPRLNRPTSLRNGGLRLPGEDYSDETLLVLGPQLNNPYPPANMATAYNVLYGTQFTAADIPVTHYYIKFTPSNMGQLAQLEEETELDLYEHPLDHEVIEDGDLYAAPGTTPNDLQPLYTVVAADDPIPNFAPHTILAALHIPPNDDLLLEEIAESQAAGAVYYSTVENGHAYLNRSDITVERVELPDCLNNGDANTDYNPWAYDPCYGGGNPSEGNPSANPCGGNALRCTDNRRPRGRLRYWDTQLGGTGRCVALQTVKVIGKNWFKGIAPRHHLYTDANGEFVHNKKFKKVKVNVHFRNAGISVRPLRIAKWLRLSIFTLKHRLSTYSGCEMNTIEYLYRRPADKESVFMEYWVAAQAIHGFDQFKQQSQADQLKPLNGWRLKYYIQRDHIARTRGAESKIYMKSYLHDQQEFWDVAISVAKIVGYAIKAKKNLLYLIPAVAEILRQVLGSQQPDIVLMYNSYPGDAETSLENMSSSELYKEICSSFARASLIKNSGSKAVKAYMKKGDKMIQAAISLTGAVLGLNGGGGSDWNLENFLKQYDPNNPANTGFLGTAGLAASYTTMTAGVFTWLTTTQVLAAQIDEEFFEIADGFGEYYGHLLADRKYGLAADAFFNEKRLLVSSGAGASSHYKYLEDWEADVDVDELARLRVGFFHDLEDDGALEVVKNWANGSLDKPDNVSNIQPKDVFKCIINDDHPNPEAATWARLKQNLISKFVSQTNQINQLCIPYRIP